MPSERGLDRLSGPRPRVSDAEAPFKEEPQGHVLVQPAPVFTRKVPVRLVPVLHAALPARARRGDGSRCFRAGFKGLRVKGAVPGVELYCLHPFEGRRGRALASAEINQALRISASRGASAPSRRRRDSFPIIMAVGGFFLILSAFGRDEGPEGRGGAAAANGGRDAVPRGLESAWRPRTRRLRLTCPNV